MAAKLAAFKAARIAITTALASSESGWVLKLSVLHPEEAYLYIHFSFFFVLVNDTERRRDVLYMHARDLDFGYPELALARLTKRN